jgi:hypothetical protein
MNDESKIVGENTKEYLKCILTELEKKELADRMAMAVSEIINLEASLKSATTQFKSDIAKHEAELSGASEKYRSGFEMRNVECRIEKDYRLGQITITRLDTNQTLRQRAMTGEERQQELPLKKETTNQDERPRNEGVL